MNVASIILIGPSDSTNLRVQSYIEELNFSPYEITYLLEKIKIEEARQIKKELSFAVRSKRLFIFGSDITIEAQNALLKTIEEGNLEVHFIFCTENEELLLPTIISRSKCIYIEGNRDIDLMTVDILKKIAQSPEGIYSDGLEGVLSKERLNIFLNSLRHLILDPATPLTHKKLYYTYCKKTLQLASLASVNNVNEKVILESIFSPLDKDFCL